MQKALTEPPSRFLVIGAGFIGSEVASVCRELDIPVTVVERGSAPLSAALGGVIGEIAARMQRDDSAYPAGDGDLQGSGCRWRTSHASTTGSRPP